MIFTSTKQKLTGRKISYVKDTTDYYRFEYENLNKSIQFAKSFISKLASFLYNDFANRKISEEEIKQLIDKIKKIQNTNYWHYFTEPTNSISNETRFDTYLKCHNIQFDISNNIDAKAYNFLFNFIPDCGKQYGKGEFLRCYAGHLPPNLMEKGDCMIRTNAVAELKNANKNEHGSLMFNRHNYYTANGQSHDSLLTYFKNKVFNVIVTTVSDDLIKQAIIKLIDECNNLSDFVWKYNDSNTLYNKIADVLCYDPIKKSEFIYKTMLINLTDSRFTRSI